MLRPRIPGGQDLFTQPPQMRESGPDDPLIIHMRADGHQPLQLHAAHRADPPGDIKRKRRIAAGSGTKVEDVNRLLRQYEQMNKVMKQLKKRPKGRRFGRMFG